MTIRKEGSKHVIRSKKGKKLGEFLSRSAAVERLGEIEFFKRKKNRDTGRSLKK